MPTSWYRLVQIDKAVDGTKTYTVLGRNQGGMPSRDLFTPSRTFINLIDPGVRFPKVEVGEDGILRIVEDVRKCEQIDAMENAKKARKMRLQRALEDAKSGKIDASLMVDLLEQALERN